VFSCGTQTPFNPIKDPSHEKKVEYDEEFEQYVESFEEDWGEKITDLTIVFAQVKQDEETPTTKLGVCHINKDTTPHIIIDPDTWETMSDTRRKLLMYHEMGHCVLFREHVEGRNTSIMNPLLIWSSVYLKDEQYFLDELFDPDMYNSWDVYDIVNHKNCDHH
jgi:hypothetical protein